ncbi:MAG TPA: glucosaminidase domain-containing protein [Chryseolinea sp.]|nr:glucosaminidase domain-containing protein [Chryseolinea sp.]
MKRPVVYLLLILAGMYAFVSIVKRRDRTRTYSLTTETIRIDSLEQISPLDGELVKPILYTNVSGLSRLPVSLAKKKFIAAVLPSILIARHQIEKTRIRIFALTDKDKWNGEDSSFYFEVKRRYKAKDINDLIDRIGTLPTSIVLSQAAVESGWGQSRFFLEGNNLFGVWSFNSDEQRMPSKRGRNNKTIYLRTYPDIGEAVVHYFEILGSASAYKKLRRERLLRTDPFELIPHLRNYSERRTSYTNQLKAVILQNELTRYDRYRLDPDYLTED